MSARTTGLGGHQSANMGKDEWLTPPDVLKALGPFDLDPCAPVSPPWPIAEQTFTIRDDGLGRPWHGFVWCNPPYGAMTKPWLKRLAAHGNGIALIFARTETEMFFDSAWRAASSMLFLEGRLYFHHVNGERAAANSGAPSVLLGFGAEADRRLRNCGFAGAYTAGWTVLKGARAGEAIPTPTDVAQIASAREDLFA
jgi:hypothetical protein